MDMKNKNRLIDDFKYLTRIDMCKDEDGQEMDEFEKWLKLYIDEGCEKVDDNPFDDEPEDDSLGDFEDDSLDSIEDDSPDDIEDDPEDEDLDNEESDDEESEDDIDDIDDIALIKGHQWLQVAAETWPCRLQRQLSCRARL